ncbi:MAG: hypothetical protein IKJ54_03265, partial [Anaerotignum sp.]|nr:hypothetical protein [Anaerotignum sp.]
KKIKKNIAKSENGLYLGKYMLTFCRGGGISVYISRYNLETYLQRKRSLQKQRAKNIRRKERYV